MDPLQPGDPASVSGYRLLGRLGAGGMGQVFLGVSPGGRKVAVKLIHPFYAETTQFRARFAREIKAARRVGGFHTAPVVYADPQADPPWMVTAYIEGPSLQEDVDRNGPLPGEGLRALGAGLAEGLAAIHASGLVHRDLKPGNVILAGDGPRIIDFGVARAVDGTSGLTTAGVVVGTFAYMSPEQVRGEVAGQASDVFSLGAVLAFAATGRPPFGADLAYTVMFRITGQPPDLAGLSDWGLAGLIKTCLAKTPEARPAIRDLLAALGGRPTIVSDSPGRAATPDAQPGPGSQADKETQPGREAAGEGIETPKGHAQGAGVSGSPGRAAPPETPSAHEPETQPRLEAAERQEARALGGRQEARALGGTPPAHEPETRPEYWIPAGHEVLEFSALGRAGRGRTSRGRARRWPAALVVGVILAAGLAIALFILLRAGTPQAAVDRRPVADVKADSATARPARGRPSPGPVRHGPTPHPTPSTAPAAITGPQLVEVPDVNGDTTAAARQILQDAGFSVKVEAYGFGDRVFDYSPVGSAPRGSTVTIDSGGF